MKLIICPHCNDLFRLNYKERSCECGKVKGYYKDNIYAEVSRDAISLAIGNGSLTQAIVKMINFQATKPEMNRKEYQEQCQVLCWVRPNEGPGNPHTKVPESFTSKEK